MSKGIATNVLKVLELVPQRARVYMLYAEAAKQVLRPGGGNFGRQPYCGTGLVIASGPATEPRSSGRFRRISPVAVGAPGRLLTLPRAGLRPRRQGLLFLPQSSPRPNVPGIKRMRSIKPRRSPFFHACKRDLGLSAAG